jgi:hypothetical protein
VIEPLAVVEIRLARDVSKYAGAFEKHMPVAIRGFVQDVRRSQQMTDSGPRRTVTITGGDYGLILNTIRYALYPGYTPDATLLSAFQFFTTYGLGSDGTQTPAQFVETINDKVIGPFLQGMQGAGGGSSPVLTMTVQALVQGGFLSPMGLQSPSRSRPPSTALPTGSFWANARARKSPERPPQSAQRGDNTN